MIGRWSFSLGVGLGIATLASVSLPCRADESSDKAAAEALYELGQKLMKDGNFTEACPKLEASQVLDPGVGTLLLLGDCDEKAGKLASAWASFKDAEALARSRGDTERANIAEVRATALRPRLTYVVFQVRAENPRGGFELRRNGGLIAPGSYGVSLPTDSGHYELVASAPERETWRSSLDVPVKLDAPLTVHVPALRPLARATSLTGPALALSPGVDAAGTAQPPPPPKKDEASGSGQRTLGIVSFGVGAAAGIVAGVLSYEAAKKNHDSKSSCQEANPNLCTPEGVDERDSAKSLATMATVFAIGGAALATTGVVLFVTAPSSDNHHETGMVAGWKGRF